MASLHTFFHTTFLGACCVQALSLGEHRILPSWSLAQGQSPPQQGAHTGHILWWRALSEQRKGLSRDLPFAQRPE